MDLKQQKILFLIPSLGTGGAERQMVALIKLLNKKEITPFVLTYYSPKNDYDDDFNLHRISIDEQNFILKYIKIIFYAYKVKPDVILSYGTIPNVLSIFISLLRLQTLAVVSERNTTQEYSFGKKMLFNLYRLAKYVVPNSLSQTDFIHQHASFLNSKVKTITNYTDIGIFYPKAKEKGSVLKIGIFARYHPQKNCIRFLNAVHAVDSNFTIEYHWFGQNFLDIEGNPTKHSDYYLSCIRHKEALGIQNIFFHSFSTNIIDSFNQFDVICLPSLYEGFSNVLSEAVCLGKPILASAVCDNILFVKDGINGFSFDPTDEKAITSSIEKFANLTAIQLQEFQFASRELAEHLFSKDTFISAYIDVLK